MVKELSIRSEVGQGIVEYAVLLALIAVVLIGSFSAFGTGLSDILYSSIIAAV